MSEAVVYRAYDADGRLLYVGLTTQLAARLRGHKSTSPWWPLVDRVEVDPAMPVQRVRRSERAQIRALAPVHNKAWNDDDDEPAPNRMRELREAHDLERVDLAVRFRVDPSSLYRYESGLAAAPDSLKLDLAKLYGVSVAHLMNWPEHAAA